MTQIPYNPYGPYDEIWWKERTKQMIEGGAEITILPTADGSFTIKAKANGKVRFFPGSMSNSQFEQNLWDARMWINNEIPHFPEAIYNWTNKESVPYEDWGTTKTQEKYK